MSEEVERERKDAPEEDAAAKGGEPGSISNTPEADHQMENDEGDLAARDGKKEDGEAVGGNAVDGQGERGRQRYHAPIDPRKQEFDDGDEEGDVIVLNGTRNGFPITAMMWSGRGRITIGNDVFRMVPVGRATRQHANQEESDDKQVLEQALEQALKLQTTRNEMVGC